jgi:hypothetical protein
MSMANRIWMGKGEGERGRREGGRRGTIKSEIHASGPTQIILRD